MIARPLITAFFGLCVAGAASAEYSPESLLVQMSESARLLNYQGILVYTRGNHVESLKLYHTNDDGIEKERLSHLTGDQRDLMRHGEGLRCVHMKMRDKHRVFSLPRIPYQRFLQSANITSGPYAISPLSLTRVANRDAYEIAIVPRDVYRYGYAITLDKETGLMLRSLTLGVNGQVLERLEYADIVIGQSIAPSVFSEFESAEHHQRRDLDVPTESKNTLSSIAWKLSWLPAGFRSTAESVNMQADSGAITGSSLYTDGLATFSVFVEPFIDSDLPMTMRYGASVVHSHIEQIASKPYLVTVVGEVPEVTAKRVAQAVRVLR